MSADIAFHIIYAAIALALLSMIAFPAKWEWLFAWLNTAKPAPETPPDPPKYYAFTVMSQHGSVRMLYIMGDHPLLWIEHERRRTRTKYDLVGVYEMTRTLWDAIEEKTLVEIDDAPMGTRRRSVRPLP